jgi:THO complex subunit 4
MGALKKVSLSFDATGKSKGVAEVVFVRRPDAISAVRKYNNVQLDGRPMKMEMTTSAVSVLDRM